MKLLYCYILFLDEKGEKRAYRGMDHVELNLSATDKFSYDVTNNSFQREDRKATLPDHFWADDNTASEYRNLYNVNVIAGQNGSGKTTAMRCMMNLLDFFHGAAHAPRWQESVEISRHRALLLLEEGGIQYLTDYAPKVWPVNSEIKTEGFHKQPQVYSCKGWDSFALQRNKAVKNIAKLLQKTKVIYLSNTMTQYDYERHLGEEIGRRRDAFIYDASIGASIGQDVAHYFSYEIYKQVQYVFDPDQDELRKEVKKQVNHEIALPHALRLRLRLEQYQKAFRRSIFPTIGAASDLKEKENDTITPKNLDLRTLLGMLCVAAYAKNLEQLADIGVNLAWHENKEYISFLEEWGIVNTDAALSTQHELKKLITEIEKRFYIFIGSRSELAGHSGSINCISVLPNGRVISGSSDSTLRVWDVTTGQCLQTLQGHEREINCVAVLPNGWVVSGSLDHTLRVWNLTTGQCMQTFVGRAYSITCVAALPNGLVVSGSSDATLRVWDATTGDCLQTLVGHKRKINCVVVLPDGCVVSGSDDHTLRVWDATTGGCLQTLMGHKGKINCVVVLPDARIVSGSDDHTLRVWDATTGDCLQTLVGHKGKINCVAVLPNGRIVSGSDDHTLRVWDATTGDCLQTFEWRHTDKIICVATLPNGRVVCGSSSENNIRIWRIDIEQMRKERPTANNLMNICLKYVDFLFDKKSEFLFSLFHRIDDITFELSLDTIWRKPKDSAYKKDNASESDGAYSLLMTFIQKYMSICQPAYTIDFDWGLSSGEENMLRVFSNLYHIFDGQAGDDHKIYSVEGPDQKTQCDTALVFMDEADLTMHPEWQRRLIAILSFFLPRIYPASCVRDMQLILSTHSPLILGDIPSENITYLFAKEQEKENEQKAQNPKNQSEKDDHPAVPPCPGETFGQNIHTLLKENFFLGKGTVGVFAAWKINRLAERLIKLKKKAAKAKNMSPILAKLPEIRQMIQLVAPGVLRTQLDILLRDVEDQIQPKEHAEIEQLLKAWKALPPEKRQATLKFMEEGGKQQ